MSAPNFDTALSWLTPEELEEYHELLCSEPLGLLDEERERLTEYRNLVAEAIAREDFSQGLTLQRGL